MTSATDTPTLTLSDLSDEDRKALLEQAREEARYNPVDVDGYGDLTPREQGIRRLMDARDHARGCPVADGSELGRVEGYDARKPPNPALGEPERWLAVIRCVECGGTTVLKDPPRSLEEALEELETDVEPAASPKPAKGGRRRGGPAAGASPDRTL